MRCNVMALVVALFVLAAGPASAQQLSEPAVRRMISEMDEAISRRDVGGVAKFLSEQVKFTITIDGFGQTQTLTMNKVTYIDMLEKGWAGAANYRYTRKNLLVRMSGDGKAIVSGDVSEMLEVQGQTMQSDASERGVVELIGGKPLFVSVVGKVQIRLTGPSPRKTAYRPAGRI